MSRRLRAGALGAGALASALLAASLAERHRGGVERELGALRPAVVVASDLPAATVLDGEAIATSLTVRRLPERFVPPATLTDPSAVAGLATRSALAAGSYLSAEQLRPPAPDRGRAADRGLGRGLVAVELPVLGAGALRVSARPGRVDVIVSGAGPRARARVAVERARLIELNRRGRGLGADGGFVATLGLSRPQALELIGAQARGDSLRLLSSTREAGP